VAQFVGRAKDENIAIAALVNNAGTIMRRFSLTADAVETTLQVNYLAPAYLSQALLPLVVAGGAVSFTFSLSAKWLKSAEKVFDMEPDKFRQLKQYARTKLALQYFAAQFAAANSAVRVIATDPGIVGTNIIRLQRWFDPLAARVVPFAVKTPEKAARITVRALADSRTACTYSGSKKCTPFSISGAREAAAARLWKRTGELLNSIAVTGGDFPAAPPAIKPE
jgi:NAD(P)-dependent dehydrogenase (short-subunit alcohol dehydrogenase family)